jgi:hypothetical protein
MTRHSAGSQSRRNSVSQTSLAGPMHSDHILSWRNSVTSNTSLESTLRNGKGARNERSVSPGKITRSSLNNLASTARQQPYAATPLNIASSSVSTTSPPASIYKAPSNPVSQPPTPGFSINSASDDGGLRLDPSGKSYQFWNMSTWKTQAYPQSDPSKLGGDLRPPLEKGASYVSKLSSDGSPTDEESDGEALSCTKCGGKDFRARKVAGKGQRLVCTKCGTAQ